MACVRSNIGGVVGEFSDLPGCPQIAVSHYVFARDAPKGRGFGQAAHKERLNLMQRLGYDIAICTVVSTNTVEKHILEKNGWSKIHQFKSSKTNNTVELWARSFTPNEPNDDENKTYDYWEESIRRYE